MPPKRTVVVQHGEVIHTDADAYAPPKPLDDDTYGDAERAAAAAILLLTSQPMPSIQKCGPTSSPTAGTQGMCSQSETNGGSAFASSSGSDSATHNTPPYTESGATLTQGVRIMLSHKQHSSNEPVSYQNGSDDSLDVDVEADAMDASPVMPFRPTVGKRTKRSRQGSTGGGAIASVKRARTACKRTSSCALTLHAGCQQNSNATGISEQLKAQVPCVKQFLLPSQARGSRTGDSIQQGVARHAFPLHQEQDAGLDKSKVATLLNKQAANRQSNAMLQPSTSFGSLDMASLLGVQPAVTPIVTQALHGPYPTLESLGIRVPLVASRAGAQIVQGPNGRSYLLTPLQS